MQFLAAGGALFVLGGAVLFAIGTLLLAFLSWAGLRKRERPRLGRNWTEHALIFVGGLAVNALVLGALSWNGSVGPEYGEELGMIGFVLTVPVAAVATWASGELLSGPSRRSLWVLIPVFLASAVGMIAETFAIPVFPRWPGHDRSTLLAGSFTLGIGPSLVATAMYVSTRGTPRSKEKSHVADSNGTSPR